MRKLLKENWVDLLGVAVAATFTDPILNYTGWPNSLIIHLIVFFGIAILVAILISLIEITIKAIRHDTTGTDTTD